MSIHHTHKKKAEKMGVNLEESGNYVRAVWPMRNMTVYGTDSKWAVEQMEYAQRLLHLAEERGHELQIHPDPAQPVNVFLRVNGDRSAESNTPMVWWHQRAESIPAEVPDGATQAIAAKVNVPVDFQEDAVPHSVNHVPTNGAVAHRQGFTAADCPFPEDDERFERWNNEFDEDADNPQNGEPEEEPQPHSVVKSKYRAIYAERGHATHCGDELAIKLNGLMHNDGGTNIEVLDMICAANEIDITKYSRTSKGWQGRLRMTARNMLARKARENGGRLAMPEQLGGELILSQDWVAGNK